MLNILSHSAQLPLYYWQPNPLRYGVIYNFGDLLFPLIVERIASHAFRTVNRFYPFPKLLAGGSIINDFARSGDTIWGAGLRHAEEMKAKRLNIRAVRGPVTRSILKSWGIACPEIYGDPAVLIPELFPEWRPAPVQGRIGIVPHFKDRNKYRILPGYIKLILPNRRPHQVVPEILQCEFVIAGSLHGLIIAEAYGIPARWLPEASGGEPELKYQDYYESTNRTPQPAHSLGHAEMLGGQESGVMPQKDKLITSFPLGA